MMKNIFAVKLATLLFFSFGSVSSFAKEIGYLTPETISLLLLRIDPSLAKSKLFVENMLEERSWVEKEWKYRDERRSYNKSKIKKFLPRNLIMRPNEATSHEKEDFMQKMLSEAKKIQNRNAAC